MEELFLDVDSFYYNLDIVFTGMVGSVKFSYGDAFEVLVFVVVLSFSFSCKDLGELDYVVEILVEI